MSNLPPLSAASDAVVKAVLAKTVEIQSRGDLSLIADGYRVCAALSIRSALQLAGHGAKIRAEDIIENLVSIADNLDPVLTKNQRIRMEASKAIELIDDYAENEYEVNHALDALKSIIYELTEG
jgi:hypothetical protein